VTTLTRRPILTRVPPSTPNADEICTRLERMKKLCDELEAAQNDTRRYNELIERIRREADAFTLTLGTHNHKS
jgi:hypothetical protein